MTVVPTRSKGARRPPRSVRLGLRPPLNATYSNVTPTTPSTFQHLPQDLPPSPPSRAPKTPPTAWAPATTMQLHLVLLAFYLITQFRSIVAGISTLSSTLHSKINEGRAASGLPDPIIVSAANRIYYRSGFPGRRPLSSSIGMRDRFIAIHRLRNVVCTDWRDDISLFTAVVNLALSRFPAQLYAYCAVIFPSNSLRLPVTLAIWAAQNTHAHWSLASSPSPSQLVTAAPHPHHQPLTAPGAFSFPGSWFSVATSLGNSPIVPTGQIGLGAAATSTGYSSRLSQIGCTPPPTMIIATMESTP